MNKKLEQESKAWQKVLSRLSKAQLLEPLARGAQETAREQMIAAGNRGDKKAAKKYERHVNRAYNVCLGEYWGAWVALKELNPSIAAPQRLLEAYYAVTRSYQQPYTYEPSISPETIAESIWRVEAFLQVRATITQEERYNAWLEFATGMKQMVDEYRADLKRLAMACPTCTRLTEAAEKKVEWSHPSRLMIRYVCSCGRCWEREEANHGRAKLPNATEAAGDIDR